MSDSDHNNETAPGTGTSVHGVSAEGLEAMANTVRELFDSLIPLAGRPIPLETLRDAGQRLLEADQLAQFVMSRSDISLDLYVVMLKTRFTFEDVLIGQVTGKELMRRARADRVARN